MAAAQERENDPVKDRVKEVIEQTGVSHRQVSAQWLGREISYLNWALRRGKSPFTERELQQIARGATEAGVPTDVDWLKTGQHKPSVFAGPLDLPVVGASSAGGLAGVTGEEFVERPPMLAGVARSFAIRIADDRLKPRYRRNDLLYFHGGQIPNVEDCVALELPNGRHVVGIFVQSGANGITLKSLAPEEYLTYEGALSVAREIGVLRG